MHLFCSLMIKNKNHNSIRLYQNYGSYLAEEEGFEPPWAFTQTVFKTASLWPLRYSCVYSILFFHPNGLTLGRLAIPSLRSLHDMPRYDRFAFLRRMSKYSCVCIQFYSFTQTVWRSASSLFRRYAPYTTRPQSTTLPSLHWLFVPRTNHNTNNINHYNAQKGKSQ